jgi:hypothetical protein
MPVLILMCAFAIDMGNFFQHRRHLQLQADASVLAAAGDLFPCDNSKIASAAQRYAGIGAGSYNRQPGGTADQNIHFGLNQRAYYNQPAQDDTNVAQPCQAGMIDVKLTETDLPFFFRAVGSIGKFSFINAHARIELMRQERSPLMPLGVQDSNPKSGRVTFVDETKPPDDPGRVIATRDLTRNGTQNGLAIWDNHLNPAAIKVDVAKIGVRVHLSGSSSTTCGDVLVECYDNDPARNGLLFIRGYSMEGTGQQPQPPLLRSVTFTAGSCSDPYFVQTTSACSLGLRVFADFGPCKDILPIVDAGASIKAKVDGSSYDLSYVSCPLGGTLSEWRTSGNPISVAPGAGPVELTSMTWEETKGTVGSTRCRVPTPCKGTLADGQHRAFSGSDQRNGPVRLAQVTEGGSPGANSLERCSQIQTSCTHNLVVKVGIEAPLQEIAQDRFAPPVGIRVARKTDSTHENSFDCDPSEPSFKVELEKGCSRKYQLNQGTACPSTSAALWSNAEPWTCVARDGNGNKLGNVPKAMNARINGSDNAGCVNQNHWNDYPALSRSDPRIVPLFLSPFGSLSGGGTSPVPVSGFATFYVTNWRGGSQNSTDPCGGPDAAPEGGIVGHFIRYVQTTNDGSAGSTRCDPNQLNNCVAVLTR